MYDFLLVRHCNYGSILHKFRDKHRYWSKIVIFHTPLHSASPLGSPRRNIVILFGVEKLWWGYPMVNNFEDIYNRLHTIPACDRQTDRQTSCDDIFRTMHTRRAVKICPLGASEKISSPHFFWDPLYIS